MKKRISYLACLLLMLGVTGCSVAKPVQPASLYDRLGGEQAITRILDRLWYVVNEDARVSHYFSHIRQKDFDSQLGQFLCQGTGGPCVNESQADNSPGRVEPVSVAVYRALAEGVVSALQQANVPTREVNEVMTLFSGMKNVIVRLAQDNRQGNKQARLNKPAA